MQIVTEGIATAAIAACISLLSLIISKESKISEFRKEWIEDLRTDISCFIAHALYIKNVADSDEPPENKHAKLEHSYLETHRLTGNINLRLNPLEPIHNEVIKAISDLRDTILGWGNFEVVNQKALIATERTQAVLKYEWARVKKGEPIYSWTVRLAFAGFAVCFVLILFKSFWQLFH